VPAMCPRWIFPHQRGRQTQWHAGWPVSRWRVAEISPFGARQCRRRYRAGTVGCRPFRRRQLDRRGCCYHAQSGSERFQGCSAVQHRLGSVRSVPATEGPGAWLGLRPGKSGCRRERGGVSQVRAAESRSGCGVRSRGNARLVEGFLSGWSNQCAVLQLALFYAKLLDFVCLAVIKAMAWGRWRVRFVTTNRREVCSQEYYKVSIGLPVWLLPLDDV